MPTNVRTRENYAHRCPAIRSRVPHDDALGNTEDRVCFAVERRIKQVIRSLFK